MTTRSEPPISSVPTVLDWLIVLPLLALASVIAVVWIAWTLTVRAGDAG